MKQCLLLSEKIKQEVLNEIPNNKQLLELANFFQNFSDSTRLKILSCLSLYDMCVNDLSVLLNVNQTTVSHQLQILRSEKIVEYRRVGKVIIYSLQKKSVTKFMANAVEEI